VRLFKIIDGKTEAFIYTDRRDLNCSNDLLRMLLKYNAFPNGTSLEKLRSGLSEKQLYLLEPDVFSLPLTSIPVSNKEMKEILGEKRYNQVQKELKDIAEKTKNNNVNESKGMKEIYA